MAEASSALFRDQILISEGKGLLIADESFVIESAVVRDNIQYMTNRKDIANQLDAMGFAGNLSDFILEDVADESLDFVLFRLNKSKVLTFYLLEQITRILKTGGHLILTGHNQEGIKSVIKHASAMGEMELTLVGKGVRYADITKCAGATLELGGFEYRELLVLEDFEQSLDFVSKPGIYGYKKIDEGSRFLVETLAEIDESIKGKVLDLGCGYGYLAGSLGDHPDVTELVATDCNVPAVVLCEYNLKQLDIPATVTLDDCGSMLEDRTFDRIICNPPFHQGFGTSQPLTEKFVQNCKRLLRRKGIAYLVVNKFIAIEKICSEQSVRCQQIASNNQFKIMQLERFK